MSMDSSHKMIDESRKTLSVRDVVIRRLQSKMGLCVIFGLEEDGRRSDFYIGRDVWISDGFVYAKQTRYRYGIRIESLLPKATDEYMYGLATALTIAFVSEEP